MKKMFFAALLFAFAGICAVQAQELPDKKASRIIIEKPVNLDNHDEWNQQFDWLVDVCIKFKKVFKKYL